MFSSVRGKPLALVGSRWLSLALVGLAILVVPLKAQLCTGTGPPCVLTAGYAGPATDAKFNSRQAINPYETTLSPTSLPGSTTGTLFEVDDSSSALPSGATSNPIMAQPLYVKGITTALGSCSGCNMVVAVTLNGTVFAWVADGSGAGNLLWSRQGTPSGGQGNSGNALWYDDCGAGGAPAQRIATLQFQGIVSTPVIDASGSPPLMFLTSYCTNSIGPEWWLHEINLQNGHDVASTNIQTDVRSLSCSGCSNFTAGWQQQRPALLEVKNSGNSSTPNLFYILFGTGVMENTYAKDYTGWVVAYTVNSGGPQPVFAYSNQPSSCGTGGGLALSGAENPLCAGNSGSPSCDCMVYLTCPVAGDTCNYSTGNCAVNTGTVCTNLGAPNWGGHGGGCWMSGNGAAATALNAINSDNDVHVFFGCGNGGFQEFNGSTPDASNNNGQTVMDFRLTQTGYDSTTPFQTFTPNSPASGVAPPLPTLCGCNASGGSCQPCTLTLQTMNANDYDMSVGGMALFNDLGGTQRLVTIDKAGYGYLLTQGNICGAGTPDTACIGFASGDPGSAMTFGASQLLCSAYPNNCDRIASMAVFDNQGSGSGRSVYLNYWPNNERLTALTLSDNSTWVNGAGVQQLTWSSGSSQTLSLYSGSCTADENCLSDQVVAGDTLTLTGCTCGGSGCPVATMVGSTSLTINMTVATAFGSCTAPQSFQYKGYFVKPAHDHTPTVGSGGYPGAAVTISANCTSPPCTNALIWAVLPGSGSTADGLSRGLGTLYAYTALPNGLDLLAEDWASADTWCASSFARPTIVNAGAFVPTYAVSTSGRSFPGGTCPTTTTSGIPYPSGILVYH
jgi:hypothetical protein